MYSVLREKLVIWIETREVPEIKLSSKKTTKSDTGSSGVSE